MSTDVRLDLEMRVDDEIDRQLDSDIVSAIEFRHGALWDRDVELVAHHCVPEAIAISRGMFEERCTARGFVRCSAGWMRGSGGASAINETSSFFDERNLASRPAVSLEDQRKILEALIEEEAGPT